MIKAKFKVDEVCIFASPLKRRDLQGEEVTIIQQEDPYEKDGIVKYWYTVHCHRTDEVIAAGEHQLSKLKPPNTPSTWENCAWKPKK